jgi:hypothetical protein
MPGKQNGCGRIIRPPPPYGRSCSASSTASRSASASLSSIRGVAFQPIFPSARKYRIASPACSNSERTSETRACLPLGDVGAFLCSHATSTQNFSFLVIRNFIFLPIHWAVFSRFKLVFRASVASGTRQDTKAREDTLRSVSKRAPQCPTIIPILI